MVKPAATNMTITLHTPLQRGEESTPVKPLVIGEQVVVHTNAAMSPILPHQPVAIEQDQTPKLSLASGSADVVNQTKTSDPDKLRDFTREQIELLSNRYAITRQQ